MMADDLTELLSDSVRHQIIVATAIKYVESDKLPPTKPENKGKVLQFTYNGSKESSRKVAK